MTKKKKKFKDIEGLDDGWEEVEVKFENTPLTPLQKKRREERRKNGEKYAVKRVPREAIISAI